MMTKDYVSLITEWNKRKVSGGERDVVEAEKLRNLIPCNNRTVY